MSDDLRLGDGTVVQGEDPLAARLDPLLAGGGSLVAPLAAEGVGWVVVERGEPGADAALARLAGAERVLDEHRLVLLRLPAPAPSSPPAPPSPPSSPATSSPSGCCSAGACARPPGADERAVRS